jgi:hypothetical protein
MNTWKHQAEPTSQKFACEHQEAHNTEEKANLTDFGPWALTKSTLRTVLVFKFALSAVLVRLHAENPISQMELSGSIKHDILVKMGTF